MQRLNSGKLKAAAAVTEKQDGDYNKMIIILCVMLLATVVGMSMVVEFGVNISLSHWTQHPLRSGWINVFIGIIILLPFFIICNKNTSIDNDDDNLHNSICDIFNNLTESLKEEKKNYMVLLNGTCGVIIIITPIYIAPFLGFALYTISVIFGQIIASMLLDNYGLFWVEIKRLSIVNFIGASSAIIGIIIYQIPSFNQTENEETYTNIGFIILYIIIAMFAGIAVTIQSALNRRLKVIIQGTPYQSAFLSFCNAGIVLTVINIIIYIILGDWFETNKDYLNWYMFFGGSCGAFIVSMMIICPSYIGFVATYICAIFGSLIMSIIFDYFDAFGVNANEEVHKSIFRIFGVIIVFIAAILVNIPSKKQYKLRNNEDIQVGDDKDMNEYQMRKINVNSKSEIETLHVVET